MIDKPFTDTDAHYTVVPNGTDHTLDLVNLESGGKYTVDLINQTCTCPDFKHRTNGGTCKHIDYLLNHERIKPYLPTQITEKPSVLSSSHNGNNGNGGTMNFDSPFSIMERKDEDQILSEMKGNVIQEFVYSFKQGQREITGLSYAGVKQIALEMGNIHCSEPVISELNGSFVCKVKAVDVAKNLEMWGVSSQPKQMKTRWGNQSDDFAVQKAVSKAERNALRKLMPERLIVEMIKEWKTKNGRGDN